MRFGGGVMFSIVTALACSRGAATHRDVTFCDRRGLLGPWNAAPATPGDSRIRWRRYPLPRSL
jgi:hypothetical protein